MMKRAVMVAAVAAAVNAGAAMQFPTNAVEMIGCARSGTNTYRLARHFVQRLSASERAELDAAVAADPGRAYFCLPRIAAFLPGAGRAVAAAIRGRYPHLAAEYERFAASGAVEPSPRRDRGRLAASLGPIVESWQLGGEMGQRRISIKLLDGYVNRCRDAAKLNVRRKLRDDGFAIVSRGGVDPAKERLDAVAAALNAPRLAGLKDALAACGVDTVQPELAFVPAAGSEEMERIIAAVYDGAQPLGAWSGSIRYALGVEAYNAFVERYNGGK